MKRQILELVAAVFLTTAVTILMTWLMVPRAAGATPDDEAARAAVAVELAKLSLVAPPVAPKPAPTPAGWHEERDASGATYHIPDGYTLAAPGVTAPRPFPPGAGTSATAARPAGAASSPSPAGTRTALTTTAVPSTARFGVTEPCPPAG